MGSGEELDMIVHLSRKGGSLDRLGNAAMLQGELRGVGWLIATRVALWEGVYDLI